jgi:hypothetical protein
LFFQSEYSGAFLYESWKRFRKYGAIATGITQNVEDCLKTDTGRVMLGNSEFMLLLQQSATDIDELRHLLKISETQINYVTGAEPGHGLIKVGNALVPFKNDFPIDTRLYKLMSTKPGEVL